MSEKLAEIENKHSDHDEDFKKVFTAIRILMNPPNKSNKKINFIQKEKEKMTEKNPLGLKKIHHVEFYVGNAKQAEHFIFDLFN